MPKFLTPEQFASARFMPSYRISILDDDGVEVAMRYADATLSEVVVHTVALVGAHGGTFARLFIDVPRGPPWRPNPSGWAPGWHLDIGRRDPEASPLENK